VLPGVDGGDELAVADERFSWIDRALVASTRTLDAPPTITDRVDRWLTARIVGPLIFLAVMWAVFELTTTIAAPLQDALGAVFSGPVTSAANWLFQQIGLGDSWAQLFVVNGLIAGVGMLLTFVPLMIIMFTMLALLEDSGYLARAAVVTDRAMRAIGLPGKAFLPLVVGFGCNVPAISATRILPNARHRVMTALLVPFTSCSARLTVYVLVAATFFPRHAGTVVFGMYLMSILVVVLVGLALRRTLWRTVGAEPLVLDLPAYQRPTLRLTASVTWLRVRGFLRTAGGIIVATVTAVWLLQAIPMRGGATFGHVAPGDSLFAALARLLAPIFAPLGFGDWHTSSALVVGFVAKEAVITSWAQTYSAADPTAGQSPAQLQDHIQAAFAGSSGGAMAAAVFAFLVFLLAYTPCVATVAAQLREIGARWTAFGIAMQVSVAWVLGAAVFQIGRLL
jgi:ferrous iron transport protein B